MFPLVALWVVIVLIPETVTSSFSFRYEGFKHPNDLYLGGAAQINGDGVLILSNGKQEKSSYVFYPHPIVFKYPYNFSTFILNVSLIFSVITTTHNEPKSSFRYALHFVVSRTRDLSSEVYYSSEVFSLWLDPSFHMIGIPGRLYPTNFLNDTRMEATVNYDSSSQIANTVLSMYDDDRSTRTPFSDQIQDPFEEEMYYVGLYCETWEIYYYILGWSFAINSSTQELRHNRVPQIPGTQTIRRLQDFLIIIFAIGATCLLIALCLILACYISWKLKFYEEIEGWEEELNFISHRFKYRDLYIATKGFKETEVIGIGGCGKVYKGVMHDSNTEVALKKIRYDSIQGMKQFIAEIISLGRLCHRNLVPLLGYCRRKGELIIVYEYMPNGSLNDLLHGRSNNKLAWSERFKIIKGLATGILYLHEEWEQVVIHRDIKPANVLIDMELNARLGDFGLAKLHTHDSQTPTTNVVGTLGYLAPELRHNIKVTKSSDMFAFGILMLEVATGRHPIEAGDTSEEDSMFLVDWVHSLWMKHKLLDGVDHNLGENYSKVEVELVLKLGLLCCHSRPEIRATIRDIIGFLDDPLTLSNEHCTTTLNIGYFDGYNDFDCVISFNSHSHSL